MQLLKHAKIIEKGDKDDSSLPKSIPPVIRRDAF
jgi:hypothetical protein